MSAAVVPAPPRVRAGLPLVGPAVGFLRNPTEFLRAARRRHGDTFLLPVLGYPLLFTFSPKGLCSLYRLREEDASFTEATRTLLGFKLPEELTSGDMSMFHHLFGSEQRKGYLANILDAVELELEALGEAGELEVFGHMKRVVHRVGFRSWAGQEAASPRYLTRLIALFERLDPEEAFVHPSTIFGTLITRKRREREALAEVRQILREIWEARRGEPLGDMLEDLHALYDGCSEAERHARVARDVVILHLASLSNLYAAMSWTLIHALRDRALGEAIESELTEARRAHGEGFLRDEAALRDLVALEQCAYESIRLAQQSITLRKVVRRCELDDGERVYTLEPGVFVATLLSVTNREGGTLDRFDASHYARNRLAVDLPQKELVSSFGHGKHACPGQRFAVAAIKVAVSRHLMRLELTPRFGEPRILATQMGAVGRADAPCPVGYRRRG